MFENDEGVRSPNQMQGTDSEGVLRNIRVNENGEIVTAGSGSSGSETGSKAKTILCDVYNVTTETSSIEVGKKISKIEVGNYSESSKVSIGVLDKVFKIGANMVIEICVDAVVDSFSLSASEASEVQVLVEGVE